MNQNDFYKGIIEVVSDGASDKNPEKLANALYFYMKQYPDKLKVDKRWTKMLKKVKMLLYEHYSWQMRHIHRFFTILSNLTKYIRENS